jgi:hypothetical protein
LRNRALREGGVTVKEEVLSRLGKLAKPGNQQGAK